MFKRSDHFFGTEVGIKQQISVSEVVGIDFNTTAVLCVIICIKSGILVFVHVWMQIGDALSRHTDPKADNGRLCSRNDRLDVGAL